MPIKTTFTYEAGGAEPMTFPFFWVHRNSGVIRYRAHSWKHTFAVRPENSYEDIVVHIPPEANIRSRVFDHDSGCTDDHDAWSNRVRFGLLSIEIKQD